ncbi:hypothetical protein [Microcoleus sp. FACHB-SPT15]|nr:hypothetical protein [Microcoleus sp. FACHB-SPT15]
MTSSLLKGSFQSLGYRPPDKSHLPSVGDLSNKLQSDRLTMLS